VGSAGAGDDEAGFAGAGGEGGSDQEEDGAGAGGEGGSGPGGAGSPGERATQIDLGEGPGADGACSFSPPGGRTASSHRRPSALGTGLLLALAAAAGARRRRTAHRAHH
jgi:hypothetical protein